MKLSRHLVSRSFDQAAATYDSAAEVQRLACQQLAVKLVNPGKGLILDAGCGTGYGSRLLHERFPQSNGIGLDISPAMLSQACLQTSIIADAEQLPLASACIDLYWCSLAAQWCCLDTLLDEAIRVLKPGGQLALATLGPATFAELRTAFAASDRYAHTLNFLTSATITKSAKLSGFKDIQIQHQPLITHHSNFKTLLTSIRAIGANQLGSGRRRGLMSRSVWHAAEKTYETLRQTEGLPLTYDLIFLVANKAPTKD